MRIVIVRGNIFVCPSRYLRDLSLGSVCILIIERKFHFQSYSAVQHVRKGNKLRIVMEKIGTISCSQAKYTSHRFLLKKMGKIY